MIEHIDAVADLDKIFACKDSKDKLFFWSNVCQPIPPIPIALPFTALFLAFCNPDIFSQRAVLSINSCITPSRK
jgi:hypothetical protein